MKKTIYYVAKYTDEITPESNGPTLRDCAIFLKKGTDDEWPGMGPLEEPGPVEIIRREITYIQYAGENTDREAIPNNCPVAVCIHGSKWWSEDIYEDYDDLVELELDLDVGDLLAFLSDTREIYIWDGNEGLEKVGVKGNA